MKKLPVDISTFSELRKSNYLYVDKTEYMYQMITGGRRFFLSRPRRFGKSLLISTLKSILVADKELFYNLWITHSDYQWKKHGVIHLDFSLFSVDNVTIFQESVCSELLTIAEYYEITLDSTIKDISLMLKQLVYYLFKRFGYVAILIDEYDGPIVKTLHNENLAQSMRHKVQQFFATIKALDEQIKFAFITGVSSFAKSGLFSGINNLQILTLQDEYDAICGYTDEEIDHYFTDYIALWAQKDNINYDGLRQEIKAWYNGYHFGENVSAVYNPFSLMNALHIKKFKNFWFQSGAPTFLIEVLKKQHQTFDLHTFKASEDSLGIFDIGLTPPITLMFQAGYLTITGYDADLDVYELDYPNWEVKKSFQKYLLEVFTSVDSALAEQTSRELRSAFNNQDIEKAVSLIKQLFAHVPYQLHSKEEKFYHALFMMICVSAGIKAQSEYSTDNGRIDLVFEFATVIYVIEIKFNKSADAALIQIKERHYYERFLVQNKSIILLGLAFKREPHNFDVTYAMQEISR